MIEKDFKLLAESKAFMISAVCSKLDEHKSEEQTKRSLDELQELLRTLGIETRDEFIQNRKTIDPATIIGAGKLEEIGEKAKSSQVDFLVFDVELTASQVRNIRKITGLAVIDRVHVILEIFAKHASTKEAKIQIEIARLQYILPRLSGFWSHLGRQKGGVGIRGGEGEQQIELDRRIIRERIEFFKRELIDVEKSRKEQKKRRYKKAVTAALVGYTNAGKSSLMNRLCQVEILEENKLFATLDSTYRMLNPDTHPPMILIDTVGFISNLPNTLIEGFKTTLESALEAELLIIVCDISDPHYKKHLQVTNEVLKDLGLENKERFIVFNKLDLLEDKMTEKMTQRIYPNSFFVSTFNQKDIKNLREKIIDYFLKKQKQYDLFLPYERGDLHSMVARETNILKSENHEKGIFYRVRVPDFIFNRLNLESFIMAPDMEMGDRL